MKLFIDTETRSFVPITHGTAKYATGVEVIVVTWAIDDGVEREWNLSRGPEPPDDLLLAVELCDEIWAHKEYFDRTVLETTDWWPKHDAPKSKWRCTMWQALTHGLPGGLDKLCEIFQVKAEDAKLEGTNYIQIFCKPNSRGEYNDWRSHPEQWKEFVAYAKSDIRAMRAIHKKMPKWNINPNEIALFDLDKDMNDRGFGVDLHMAESMIRATTAERKRLGDRVEDITDGAVQRATQRDKLLGYLLLEYDISLPDLKADTIERRLEDPELPEYVKELLRIRLQATKSSTAKYKRVMQSHTDGRIRGGIQFRGAQRTGRAAGRLVQPHNFPRPSHKFPAIELAIEAFKAGIEDLCVDDIMLMASSALRSVITAAPGHKLCVSDLANIEGRMIAWLSVEQWKLDAFRAYDSQTGPDLYKVAYGRSFGVDPNSVEDDSDERQIGKVMELALGYQGGVGAFVTMAATYGVDLDLLAERAWPTIPREVLSEAKGFYKWAVKNKRDMGLPEKVFVVCQSLVIMWRNAHPKIVQHWADLEEATKMAILNKDTEFKAGRVTLDRKGNWLRMRLPSGRFLCYPNPQLRNIAGRDVISYMGVNVYNKRWHRISTYGGKLAENETQASSGDIIFGEPMLAAEAEGYRPILTVHDELMTEPPDDSKFTDERISQLLSTNPKWAPDIPLSAKGFTTYRYRKG